MADTKRINLNLNLAGLKFLAKAAVEAGNDNVLVPVADLNACVFIIEAALKDLHALGADLIIATNILKELMKDGCYKENLDGKGEPKCKADDPNKCLVCRAVDFLNKPRKYNLHMVAVPPKANQ